VSTILSRSFCHTYAPDRMVYDPVTYILVVVHEYVADMCSVVVEHEDWTVCACLLAIIFKLE
jgi:hypothetical protein